MYNLISIYLYKKGVLGYIYTEASWFRVTYIRKVLLCHVTSNSLCNWTCNCEYIRIIKVYINNILSPTRRTVCALRSGRT